MTKRRRDTHTNWVDDRENNGDYDEHHADGQQAPAGARNLSLPHGVAKAGGIDAWNSHPQLAQLMKTLEASCTAKTVQEALAEVRALPGA